MKKDMSEAEEEQSILDLTAIIFDKYNTTLIDKEGLSPRQVELYEKSLSAGIATAVGFVIVMGDSLSKSDRDCLAQGTLPYCVATSAFKGLIRKLPKLRKGQGDRKLCFITFYAGIGVAVAFMETEFRKA